MKLRRSRPRATAYSQDDMVDKAKDSGVLATW